MTNTTLDTYEGLAVYKLCIYGAAKIGKTALAAQLARVWTLWYFDLEDGLKTALKPSILAPEFRKNINVFRIPTKQSAPMGIETLLKVIKGKECKICWIHGKVACPECIKNPNAVINRICTDEFGPTDCLVIDSTTQLTADAKAASLAFILKDATVPEDFVMDKESGGKNFKYPEAVTYMLDKIFTTLQNAHFNSISVTHEVMTETIKNTAYVAKVGENQPSTGEESIFPAAGSRNYSRQFARFFDMLIHLDIVNKKHRAYSSTTYSSLVQTGSRLPWNIEDMKDGKGEILPPFEAIVKMFDPACREELLKLETANLGKLPISLVDKKQGTW